MGAQCQPGMIQRVQPSEHANACSCVQLHTTACSDTQLLRTSPSPSLRLTTITLAHLFENKTFSWIESESCCRRVCY